MPLCMKALTLYNPWAMFIPWLEKSFETRPWYTPYRGLLAIHASKNVPSWVKELCKEEPFTSVLNDHGISPNMQGLPFGAVIATCNLIDCLSIREDGLYKYRSNQRILPLPNGNEYAFGDYRPGRCALILRDIEPLKKPIPAIGHQRLWNWELPNGFDIAHHVIYV